MHCDIINRKTGMFALAAVVLMITASFPTVDADTSFDKDYGQFYSYTLQFVFDGSDAESIEWDFGDGTKSTDWNPTHTYSAKGVYYVTQTTTNSYQGGSTTVEVYKVEIMGFPVISFDTLGGPTVSEIQQTAYNVTAVKPADPIRSGYTFGGWFTDTACTQPYNWDSKVIMSMTLYAKWTADSPVQVDRTVSFDVNGGSVPMDPVTVQDGSVFTVPGYSGTLEGHAFKGWKFGNTVYQAGQVISVSSDMVLTVEWESIGGDPSEPEDPSDPSNPDDPSDPEGPSDGDDHGDTILGVDMKVLAGIVLIVLAILAFVAYRRMH